MKDMCITISGLKLTCLSLRAVAITHTRIALNHQNWSSSTLVLDFEPKMMDMYIYIQYVIYIYYAIMHIYGGCFNPNKTPFFVISPRGPGVRVELEGGRLVSPVKIDG